jgi:hypothetical protein
MQPDELFFIAEAVRHARSLPFTQSLRFIGGLILSLDEEHVAVGGLRSIYTSLVASEQQLDLVQLGQMTLDAPKKKKGGRR